MNTKVCRFCNDVMTLKDMVWRCESCGNKEVYAGRSLYGDVYINYGGTAEFRPQEVFWPMPGTANYKEYKRRDDGD